MLHKKQNRKFVIDLDGPEGNASVLLGYAQRFSREIGIDVNEVLSKMKESDYKNLINVFM